MALGRRSWLTALAALAGGCSSKPSPAEEQQRAAAKAAASSNTSAGAWRDGAFDKTAGEPDGQLAAVYAPDGSSGWPLLIALHGRGEAGRGLAAGAHGWRDDYDIDGVRAQLEAGKLSRADSKEMLSEARIAELVAALGREPWRGL